MTSFTLPPSDPANPPGSPQRVTELAVNLDDTTGEVIGDAARTLLAEGALDVWTTPIQMKKQRPGVMLSVLCAAEHQDATARRVLTLTGSFGVRMRAWDRMVLDREHVAVSTPLGEIAVKVGRLDGRILVAQPEFDAVKRCADIAGISVREAMAIAQTAATAWRTAEGTAP